MLFFDSQIVKSGVSEVLHQALQLLGWQLGEAHDADFCLWHVFL